MRHLPTPPFHRIFVMIGGVVLAGAAQAQVQREIAAPSSVYLQAGFAEASTRSETIGVTWPWPRGWQFDNRSLSGHWDAYLSHWSSHSATSPGSRESLMQVGLVPVLRWRFDQGRSAWFAEGGIGFSYSDALYETPRKRFSTRFNFADHIGLGVNFGDGRQHELALRLQHISNADIRKPNPGENFIQLRYSRVF